MSDPGLITLDPTAFRAQFKAFASTPCFPDTVLQGWWDTAANFVTDWRNQCIGTASQRVLAINLVTAHIGALYNAVANGEPTGVLTSAQIDKIRVDTKPPPAAEASNFQWWLSQTPYGQQLLALFATMTVGGIYVGGLPERDAIRRVGGGFGGRPAWGVRMAKVIRTKGPAYEPFIIALASLDKVTGKVGWFETAHYPDGGPPVALVAAVNEYGWPEHNIPPRLGMRATADAMHAVWTAVAFEANKRVLKGEITAAEAMEIVTAKAAGDIRKHIATVTQPPLKVATVKARLRGKDQGNVVSISAAKPLVHTGHLLATLTNVVEGVK